MAKPKKRRVKKPHIPIKTESGDEAVNYPIFCFRYLQPPPCNDHKFYSDLIIRLKKLSGLTWDQINKSSRHGFGTEKLPVGKVKPDLPRFVTPDITHLTVFRANGDNRPFLGIRNGKIFHIIFIEECFGDIYDH